MSSIKSFKVGENTYMFICQFRSTRSGFAHDCELIKNTSAHLGKASCHYLNRTWESYTYQTVMRSVVSQKLDSYHEAAVQQFRREHNITRLTAKRKPELEAFIEAQRQQIETWRELTELYEKL